MQYSKTLFSKLGIFILMAGLTLAGCDNTVSNDGGNKAGVTLQFQTVSSSASAGFTALAAKEANNKLTIKGDNGTLVITDIHFIVDDFELEQVDGECKGLKGEKEDDCEEFEGGLFFVNLPLNNKPLQLSTSPIRSGVYNSLEFEIDDLDLDEEEDSAEKQEKKALLANIRSQFSNWPKSASMVVTGSFTSNAGEVTKFMTFAEAEVSIEMEITPPLKIQNMSGKSLTVNISPAKWFTNTDGSVINLAEYDYSTTQKVMEFEAEINDGFDSTDVEQD